MTADAPTMNRHAAGSPAAASRWLAAALLAVAALLPQPVRAAGYDFNVNACAGARFGSDLGCTANDVGITGIAVVDGPSSCVVGDTVEFDLDVTINSGNPSRYDIGLFLSKNGQDPQLSASGNNCEVGILPLSPAPAGVENLDSNGGTDICGDIRQSNTAVIRMNNVQVLCQTSSGSAGYLNIPFVVSWDQGSSPPAAVCDDNRDPVPGTTSKCNKPAGNEGVIAVVVLPAITKTNSLTAVYPGQTFNYTVTITNTTNTAMSNVVFTDPLASNMTKQNNVTCSASGGASCPSGGPNYSITTLESTGLTIPSLPASVGSVTFTIPVLVSSSISTGSITNTATASYLGSTATATDTDTIMPTISKTDGVDVVAAGNNTTYTVTISNATGNNYTNVVFTDPAVTNITMNTVSCSAAGGASCPASSTVAGMQGAGLTIPSLPSGGSVTFTLGATFSISATPGSTLTNTATLTVGGTSRSASDADLVAVSGQDPYPDKSHSGDFALGGQGSWTITVVNGGQDATTSTITVTDTLNTTNFSYVSASGTGWSCSYSAPTITCTHAGSIAGAGTSAPITVTVNVLSATGTPVTNTATVSMTGDVNTGNNSDDDPTAIVGADLGITKSHTGNFSVGSNNTWTLTVANNGPLDHSGTITVTDTLNTTNFNFVSASGSGWGCSWFSPTVTCTYSASLVSGATAPAITLTVETLSATGSPVTNTASVSGTTGDVNTGNNSDDDPTAIDATGRTCWVVSNGNDRLITRHTGTGTLTDIGALGPAATNMQGLAYQPVTNTLYGANSDKFMTINTSTGNATFIGSFGTGSGANGSVTFNSVQDLTYDASTGAMYAVHVVSTTESLLFQVNTSTGTYIDDAFGAGVDYVEIGADIVVKGIAADPITGTLYGIDSDASTDALISINKTTGATTTIGNLGQSINDAEDLGTDDQGNLWVVVGDADASPPERRLYSVSKSTGAATLNGQLYPVGGNTYTEFEGVDCQSNAPALSADVRILKTASNTIPPAGSQISYTVTATNLGPDAATTLIVQDSLPSGVSYVSHVASQGSYSNSSGVWSVGTVSAGASATLTITVNVTGSVGVPITNTATRTFHNQTDSNAGNDSASVDITPASATTATILKSVALICDPYNFNTNPKFIPGAYVRYTLTITNTGGSPVTLTTISDSLSQATLDPDLRTGTTTGCESSPPMSAINNSVRVSCSNTASDCLFTQGTSGGTGIRYFTGNSSDGDGVGYSGTLGVTPGTLTLNFATMGDASLQGGATMTVYFNTIIE